MSKNTSLEDTGPNSDQIFFCSRNVGKHLAQTKAIQ